MITTPTRAMESGYPPGTRSVDVHLKAWGMAPFLPLPAAELCDRPVTIERCGDAPPLRGCATGSTRRTDPTRC
ncbi:hypothetical protein ACXJJ3_01230 [Kribbella sp. WER1]